MRILVHVIVFIFATLNLPAIVNAISSSSSDSSTSDSNSSSGTTSTSRSNSSSTETKSQPGTFTEAQDHLETTSAQNASNIPPFETSLDNLSAAERKRIKSREYMREKRKRFPELDREARRRYREAQRKDPERKAKKSLSDKIYNIKNKERKRIRDQEYRQRNHESILRKQREARAKQKQLSAPSSKKRKKKKTIQESSHKKIRLDTSSNAHPIAQVQQSENKASSTFSTPNNQQSQRRNVLRIKLSQETIQKYLSITAVNTSPLGSLDSADKNRVVVDKKELKRIKKMEYQRTYRANNPEKAKTIDARSREKRDKDPIRKEQRRIYRLKYDRQRREERKDVQQDSQTVKHAKGKRKRVEYEDQFKSTITRVRTYGKAPKSSAFINPGTSEKLFLEDPSSKERVVPETQKFNKPDAKVRISFSPKRLRTTEVPANHSS